MIRNFHLADLFTIANAFCGVAAVFQAMSFLATQEGSRVYVAALLVPVAGCFDCSTGASPAGATRPRRWAGSSIPSPT